MSSQRNMSAAGVHGVSVSSVPPSAFSPDGEYRQIHSSDEEEDEDDFQIATNCERPKGHVVRRIQDSDSSDQEENDASSGKEENLASEGPLSPVKLQTRHRRVYLSGDESEEEKDQALKIEKPSSRISEIMKQQKQESEDAVNLVFKNRDLFDPEDSEDEKDEVHQSANINTPPSSDSEDAKGTDIQKKKSRKQKTPKKRVSNQKGESEAKKIHSVSQRMMREAPITLPYHRPRQRTLQEFLNRKKLKLDTIKPKPQELEKITKKLKEMDKEVEQFYKSDDDQDMPTQVQERSDEVQDDSGIQVNGSQNSCSGEEETQETPLPYNKADARNNQDGYSQSNGGDIDENKENVVPAQQGAHSDQDPENKENISPGHEIVEQEVNETNELESVDCGMPLKVRKSLFQESCRESHLSAAEQFDVSTISVHDHDAKSEPAKDHSSVDEARDSEDVDSVPITLSNSKIPKSKPLPHSVLLSQVLSKNQTVLTKKPQLSSNESGFIDLGGDEDDMKRKSSGILGFMERFLKHSYLKPTPKKKDRDVKLNIVHKDTDSQGLEELKLETVTVHLRGEEEPNPEEQAPGAKLLKLKQALQAKIRQKREEEIKRKQELHAMDNEQDLDADEPMEEDEEAQFTDVDENEDSSDEEDEEEELLEDVTEIETESKKPRNPFVDDEAEEDDEIDDPGYEDNDCSESQLQSASEDVALDTEHDDSVERQEQELPDIDGPSSPVSHLTQFVEKDARKHKETEDVSEADTSFSKLEASKSQKHLSSEDLFASSQYIDEAGKKVEREKDEDEKEREMEDGDGSFNLTGSLIPPYQPGGGITNQIEPDKEAENENIFLTGFLTPFEKSRENLSPSPTLGMGRNQSFSRHPTMPIDDTQEATFPDSTPDRLHSLPSPLKLISAHEDSPVSSSKKLLDQSKNVSINSEDNMKELLGLCSGRFSPSKKGIEKLCSQREDEENMEELLALCSGQFGKNSVDSSSLPRTKSHGHELGESEDLLAGFLEAHAIQTQLQLHTPEKLEESTIILQKINAESDESDDEVPVLRRKKRKLAFSDDDDNISLVKTDKPDGRNGEQGNEDEEGSSDELCYSNEEPADNKLNLQDYLEEEAELSGSEASEDESEGEEEENGDVEGLLAKAEDEAALPSISKIQAQLSKVHVRQAIDQDIRELRLMQEIYLEDGDLHSDAQRQRKFKWKSTDGDSEELERRAWDDEVGVVEDQEEDASWRVERFEREKWKHEAEKFDSVAEDPSSILDSEDSQFLRMGHKALQRMYSRDSNGNRVFNSEQVPKEPTKLEGTKKPASSASLYSLLASPDSKSQASLSRKGSFLARGSHVLECLAQVVKTGSNSNATSARGSKKNFVFAALSPKEVQKKPKSNFDNVRKDAQGSETSGGTEQKGAKRRKAATPQKRPLKKPRVDRSFQTLDEPYTPERPSLWQVLPLLPSRKDALAALAILHAYFEHKNVDLNYVDALEDQFCYGLGAALGLFTASVNPTITGVDAKQQTAREVLRDMKHSTLTQAKNFALIGAMFSAVECTIETYRGCDDLKNGTYAGAVTGGIIGLRVQVVGGRGNNLHEVEAPDGSLFLVSMPPKFRKNVWIKRGDFVVVEPIPEGDKVKAEITNILYKDQIKHIQEEGLWPTEFIQDPEVGAGDMKKGQSSSEDEDDDSSSTSDSESDLFENPNRPKVPVMSDSSSSESDSDCEDSSESDSSDPSDSNPYNIEGVTTVFSNLKVAGAPPTKSDPKK
ncbi:unnamed protein product [Darwinula stevensoni]|uniref:S1-like domain-containing protein n=1 Tax=Darwinula stevensoni TaxID=69355 RepID=A0A7R8X431_9CRUS|nr:unnamed protein product [Darwinula stevensoni]CAG0878644.1 unnamed protein product [Darwinula stevensoni]